MQKTPGSETWIDPDDAPPLSAEMMAIAEVFEGDMFVRRGRGRPATGNAREVVSFRLDRDLVAKLREAGPGWQSRVNGMLRAAVGMPTAGGPIAFAATQVEAIQLAQKMAEAAKDQDSAPRSVKRPASSKPASSKRSALQR